MKREIRSLKKYLNDIDRKIFKILISYIEKFEKDKNEKIELFLVGGMPRDWLLNIE